MDSYEKWFIEQWKKEVKQSIGEKMDKNKKGQWVYETDPKGINKVSLAEAIEQGDQRLIREIELRAREGKVIRII